MFFKKKEVKIESYYVTYIDNSTHDIKGFIVDSNDFNLKKNVDFLKVYEYILSNLEKDSNPEDIVIVFWKEFEQ